MIRATQASLVVIDPLMAFLPPEVAANNDQCVRRVLGALAAIAARTGCTIILIRHLRKQNTPKAVHRGLGSVGIIGAVRAGLLVAPHPHNHGERVLAVTKTNLTNTPPSLAFLVGEVAGGRPAILWLGPTPVTVNELDGRGPMPLQARDRAADWLHRVLAKGPQPAKAMLAAAATACIPEVTLKRAKEDARIKSHLVHTKAGERIWYWYDPSAPWPKDAPFPKPDPHDLPPLEDFL
jgi:hypothetical protein